MKKNNFYKDKIILVTGGAGSIGGEIVRSLLKLEPKAVRIFDNNETGIFDLEHKLQSKKTRAFVGDVRDFARLRRAMEGVHVVFHAAALKHVPLCEYNPFEAVQTNVIGTQNVIDACLATGVKRMINISTDKAVNPPNVMGATKILTEKLVAAVYHYSDNKKTICSSVRFGNVLNSRGSMLPLFHSQIKNGGPLTLTNPKMIRFIMSIPKAVELVLQSAETSRGGEIFILKMPAARLSDFAEAVIEELAPVYGYKPEDIKIKIIGERIGEKLCEEMITQNELSNAYEAKDMFIIKPNNKKNTIRSSLINNWLTPENSKLLTVEEIKKLLREVLSLPNTNKFL